MLDIRAQKQNPKAPDFQCPDANCLNDKGYRTGAWLPKGPKSPPAPPSVPGTASAQGGAFQTQRDAVLLELFWDCFDNVLAGIAKRKLVEWAKPETIAALTATQFIQRAKG